MTYLSQLMIRQTLRILLNKKITGLPHFKPNHHWDLMVKWSLRNTFSFCFIDYVYGRTVFGELFPDIVSRFSIVSIVVVAVLLVLLFFALLIFYYYYYVICGYVRYYFVRLLVIPIIHVHAVCIPFYVIFNICNVSITFFIALFWILFSYLLTVSLMKLLYSIL